MESENSELLAGHPAATKVAGRRMSQNTGVPTMIKERGSLSNNKDKEDEEEDSEQLIRQDDNKYMFEQMQRHQQNIVKQQHSKTMNHEINRAPDPVKNKHIRQPPRFPAGLPKETKMIMKEMKDN